MRRLFTFTFLFIASTIGYSQILDVNFTGNCTAYIGLTEVGPLTQSFTAGITGTLSKIKVGVEPESCTETTIMTGTAKVYDKVCNGTILASQRYSFSTNSNSKQQEIIFTSPAYVYSGQTYFIELSVDPGQKCKLAPFSKDMETVFGRWHSENEMNCGGTYSGGTGYEPGCAEVPLDFYIQTFVDPSTSTNLDVNFTGNCTAYIGLSEVGPLAQSFTAGITGTLSKVKVGVEPESCTETTVMTGMAKIYEGTCKGTVLATEPYTFSTTSSSKMQEITFTSPAIVTSGKTYTLELSVNPGQKCKLASFSKDMETVFGRWHAENEVNCGGTYSGGTGYEPGCVEVALDFYIQTFVETITGSIESENNSFLMFPNPVSTQINVKANEKIAGSNYTIYDNTGKFVSTGKINSKDETIELGKISNGIYLIKIGEHLKQTFIVINE